MEPDKPLSLEEILNQVADFSPHNEKVYTKRTMGPYEVFVFPADGKNKGFWTIDMPSSKDPSVTYTVIIEEDMSMECSCKGWIYRQTCKHQDELQNYMRARLA